MDAIGSNFPLRIPDAPAARPAGAPTGGAAPARDDAATAAASAPARPPVGEASLWDLLTPEERAFFTQQAALGPLSYRPDGAARAGAPLPTGRHIDVRG
jgi:hypothetical protein